MLLTHIFFLIDYLKKIKKFILKIDEDCKEFVSSNLASAIQSLENTKVKT